MTIAAKAIPRPKNNVCREYVCAIIAPIMTIMNVGIIDTNPRPLKYVTCSFSLMSLSAMSP